MSCLGAMPWLYTRLCLRLPKVGKISDYVMAAAGLEDQTARKGRLCMNESIASMLVTQESAADRSIWCPPYLNAGTGVQVAALWSACSWRTGLIMTKLPATRAWLAFSVRRLAEHRVCTWYTLLYLVTSARVSDFQSRCLEPQENATRLRERAFIDSDSFRHSPYCRSCVSLVCQANVCGETMTFCHVLPHNITFGLRRNLCFPVTMRESKCHIKWATGQQPTPNARV